MEQHYLGNEAWGPSDGSPQQQWIQATKCTHVIIFHGYIFINKFALWSMGVACPLLVL